MQHFSAYNSALTFLKATVMLTEGFSKTFSFEVIFRGETWTAPQGKNYTAFVLVCCLLSAVIFSQGPTTKSLHFSFKAQKKQGNCQPFNSPIKRTDTIGKGKFCFTRKTERLAKAICGSLQHALHDPLNQRAVCLMNLFLERSVKWQAHYIFWLDSWYLKPKNRSILETWFLKVSSLKTWGSRLEWLSTYFWAVL